MYQTKVVKKKKPEAGPYQDDPEPETRSSRYAGSLLNTLTQDDQLN